MKRLVFLSLMLMAGSAPGTYITGNKLMKMCDGTKTHESRPSLSWYANCLGYLQGVADTLETAAVVCIPEGVKTEELRQVVLPHMKAHPEEWKLAAASHVLNAYSEIWPCKQ